MSLILSDRLYIDTTVDSSAEANRPAIGLHNVFALGTLSPSNTAAEAYKENIADYNTYDFWKPRTLPAWMDVELPQAETVDYFAIAGHNLATTNCTVTAQYYDNDTLSWVDLAPPITPTNNKDFLVLFPEVSATVFSVYITGDTPPRISVMNIGKSLRFPKNFYRGHTPISLARQSEVRQNISEGGYTLGVSHLRSGARTNVSVTNINAGWIRNNLEAFNSDAENKGFFFAWRPSDFSSDVAYCWLDSFATATNTNYPELMNLNMRLSAHVELGEEIKRAATECFSGEVGEYTDGTQEPRYSIEVFGQYVFATGWQGMFALDVSDPTNPTLADSTWLSLRGSGLAITNDGQTAFFVTDSGSVFGAQSDFYSIDISDPTALAIRHKITDTTALKNCTLLQINAAETYAFTAATATNRVTTVDISDPNNVSVSDTVTHADIDYPYGVALSTDENYLFVSSMNNDSVLAFDVSDPTSITYVSTISSAVDNADLTQAHGVAYYEGFLYVAARMDDLLTVLDVSNPAAMQQVTSTDGEGNLFEPLHVRVDAVNGVLYVTGGHGVAAFSILDPDNPEFLTLIDTNTNSTETRGVAFNNDYMFVTTWAASAVRVVQLESCGCVSI
ncbi:MAG: hypothetical protein D6711_13770 [Chloroflexi bacterium]|nr:MAG: hypothetical protein D6711_13770 [Chloroflexota bacterium]